MAGANKKTTAEVAASHGLELLRRIGRGGMGDVYLAKRRGAAGFEKRVVVKALTERLAEHEDFTRTLAQEANLMVGLAHPNVVQVYDLIEESGEYLMVLEYVEGCSLRRLIGAAVKRKEPLPLSLSLSVTISILRALDYAHGRIDDAGRASPVIHCDVSPENVLLSRHGEVKITDFGIARVMHTTHITGDGQIRGKLRYVAPEQVEGGKLVPATDVYSTTLVLYELLTLETARRAEDTIALVSEALRTEALTLEGRELALSPEARAALDEIVRRGSAQRLDQRYPNARAMADAIQKLAVDHGISLGNDVAVAPFVRDWFEAGVLSVPEGDPVATGAGTATGVTSGGRRSGSLRSGGAAAAQHSLRADAPIVLVVDDSPVARRVLERALPRFGWRVHSVESGTEALDWLADNHCDVVLADLNMPELSGLELCSLLRSNPSLGGLPVILLTSETDSNRAIAGLGVGADDYIRKGVTEAEIAARLNAVLRRSRVP